MEFMEQAVLEPPSLRPSFRLKMHAATKQRHTFKYTYTHTYIHTIAVPCYYSTSHTPLTIHSPPGKSTWNPVKQLKSVENMRIY